MKQHQRPASEEKTIRPRAFLVKSLALLEDDIERNSVRDQPQKNKLYVLKPFWSKPYTVIGLRTDIERNSVRDQPQKRKLYVPEYFWSKPCTVRGLRTDIERSSVLRDR